MTRERIVTLEPAFDRRDLDPAKNYGVHGVELRMVLKGEEGATQFLLYTNWMLPHVTAEQDKRSDRAYPHLLCHPMPADLGYHRRTPRYEGQTQTDHCEYVGGPCYYDGSGLNAEEVFQVLLEKGSEGVWAYLDNYYDEAVLDQEAVPA